jgi:elongator complex protein 3
LNLVLRWYKSSVGQECFISFEDELGYLYWFTRLLLPTEETVKWVEWLEKWTAIIRELHVYWELQRIWEKTEQWTQHTWLWRRLLSFAEKLSHISWFNQLSVISWVGVREYYRKLWFELRGTYMSKDV